MCTVRARACVCVCGACNASPLCQQYQFDRASQQRDRRYYWLFVCRISPPCRSVTPAERQESSADGAPVASRPRPGTLLTDGLDRQEVQAGPRWRQGKGRRGGPGHRLLCGCVCACVRLGVQVYVLCRDFSPLSFFGWLLGKVRMRGYVGKCVIWVLREFSVCFIPTVWSEYG